MPLLKKKAEKESVVYPASKRKAEPYKPLRPSKVARTDSTGSERSSTRPANTSSRIITIDDEETNKDKDEDLLLSDAASTDDDLPPNPLAAAKSRPSGFTTAKATHNAATKKLPVAAPAKRQKVRTATPLSSPLQQEAPNDSPAPPTVPPAPSQSDQVPTIPQPLLVRLLHQHFTDKSTKIEKQAMQVVQKYMEVFIRESIARAKQSKEEAVNAGEAKPEDKAWLEMEDLEKVAPGMVLDF